MGHAGSPTPRIRQRNGFLRPSSAGRVPDANRRSSAARPTVQELSGVRDRLSGRGRPASARSAGGARPSSARIASARAQAAQKQKDVDDVQALPSY